MRTGAPSEPVPRPAASLAADVVLAVDLGKTGCRAARWPGPPPERYGRPPGAGYGAAAPPPVRVVEGSGAPGLAEPGGDRRAADAALPLLRRLLAGDAPGRPVLGVGAAGAVAAGASARRLAGLLLRELPVCSVAVTSDAVAAHAGALAGGPGVVLAAGTGAVALGVSAGGGWHRADGWGPELGDEGGGAWVGSAALRAVLRHHDGRGPATALTTAARARFGDLARLPEVLAAGGTPARTAAAFGPDVVRCAEAGDPVAVDLLTAAARALAQTTLAAVRAPAHPAAADRWTLGRPAAGDDLAAGDNPAAGDDLAAGDDPAAPEGTRNGEAVAVAIVGGLSQWGPALLDPWRAELAAAARRECLRLQVVPPRGTALDGAALLAARTDLPHEPLVVRAATAAPDAAKEPQ